MVGGDGVAGGVGVVRMDVEVGMDNVVGRAVAGGTV